MLRSLQLTDIVRTPRDEKVFKRTLLAHGWTQDMIYLLEHERGGRPRSGRYELAAVQRLITRGDFQAMLVLHYESRLRLRARLRAAEPPNVQSAESRRAASARLTWREAQEAYRSQLAARHAMESRARPGSTVSQRAVVPTQPQRVEAHAAPRPASNGAMAPSSQRCPVCDQGGVPQGRFRHSRCDGKSKAASAPSSRFQDDEAARKYRRLVETVERREEQTRGRRGGVGASHRVRIAAARRAVLVRSGGRCENPDCLGQPEDLTDDGRPILEVDHVEKLADGGRDHPSQMVALCPNCHAVKTRGRTRDSLREVLAGVAARAHATWVAAPITPEQSS